MTYTMSNLSTEYIGPTVSATANGAVITLSGTTVQMAFVTPNVDPVSGDWQSASWETIGTSYRARCLVGPNGGLTLADGTYEVWVKISAAPETPVKATGQLEIT